MSGRSSVWAWEGNLDASHHLQMLSFIQWLGSFRGLADMESLHDAARWGLAWCSLFFFHVYGSSHRASERISWPSHSVEQEMQPKSSRSSPKDKKLMPEISIQGQPYTWLHGQARLLFAITFTCYDKACQSDPPTPLLKDNARQIGPCLTLLLVILLPLRCFLLRYTLYFYLNVRFLTFCNGNDQ